MSIRLRLLLMCFVVAILPAIPLTYLVQDLLEKSFSVGLSPTVADALESGMSVSRKHMIRLQTEFEQQAEIVANTATLDRTRRGAILKQSLSSIAIDGYLMAAQAPAAAGEPSDGDVPQALNSFALQSEFTDLVASSRVILRRPHVSAMADFAFFETQNKGVQLALWTPQSTAGNRILFYRKIDADFLRQAGRVLDGNQIFAQLRLAQGTLGRSFFYPFVVVYAVVLLLALLLALFMAERMARPVRSLAGAAETVAGGDWSIQLKSETGGEIGKLVDSFNLMVRRLDAQRRRLLDMEKIAGWREMARHLAHEIKNPLLPIRLAVQEMHDQYPGDDAKYREFIAESSRIVEDELEHLQRLVREFSSFARMPGLSPAPGSVESLVSDVAKLYPKVQVRIVADDHLPAFLFDADQMRRVIVNLFDNSVSVTPEGRETRVAVDLKRSTDNVVMVFSDKGPGIPEENISRVFDPYFTTRRTGTGLGLAMVKNIILMHEGTIEVENLTVGGAAFTVTLPMSGPQTSRAGAESKEEG